MDDLIRSEVIVPKVTGHRVSSNLLDFAYDELDEDARPELSGQIENLDSYDVVLVGATDIIRTS